MNLLQFDAQWFEWKIKLHTGTKGNTRSTLIDLGEQRNEGMYEIRETQKKEEWL